MVSNDYILGRDGGVSEIVRFQAVTNVSSSSMIPFFVGFMSQQKVYAVMFTPFSAILQDGIGKWASAGNGCSRYPAVQKLL